MGSGTRPSLQMQSRLHSPLHCSCYSGLSSAGLQQVPSDLGACALSAHTPWNSLPSVFCLVHANPSISSQLWTHLVGEAFPNIQTKSDPFYKQHIPLLNNTHHRWLYMYLWVFDSCQTPHAWLHMDLSCLLFLKNHFNIIFKVSSNTQPGARTHHPEIKSHVFHWLSQKGAPRLHLLLFIMWLSGP